MISLVFESQKKGQDTYVGPIILHAFVISLFIQKYSQAKRVGHKVCVWRKTYRARGVLNIVS